MASIEQTGLLSARLAELHAEHAADFRDILIRKYHLPAPLATALAASAELESGLDASVTQDGKNGHGQGLFQLTDPARMALFKRFSIGKTIEESTADQQIKFQIFELAHNEQHKFALVQRVGSDAANIAAGYSYYVERFKLNLQVSADRYTVARALDKIEIPNFTEQSGPLNSTSSDNLPQSCRFSCHPNTSPSAGDALQRSNVKCRYAH